MSLQLRLEALAASVGADVKSLQSQINNPSKLTVTPYFSATRTKGRRVTNVYNNYAETVYAGILGIGFPTFLKAPAVGYMFKARISGYDFYTRSTWELLVGGYATATGIVNNPSMSMSGFPGGINTPKVRWGYDGFSRIVLLIGDDAGNNSFAGINIESFDVWYDSGDPTEAQMLDFTVMQTETLSFYTNVVNADGMGFWRPAALQAPWVNYGTTFQTTRYRLRNDGVVEIQGLVKSGATGGTIFTLPAGLRPDASLIFPVFMAGGVARLDIGNTGIVSSQSWPTGATNSFLSLAGVTFTAAGRL